jgi:GNAT superfamily N-acetyltransferase
MRDVRIVALHDMFQEKVRKKIALKVDIICYSLTEGRLLMQKPRSIKLGDSIELMDFLNNIFRISRGCPPTMFEEYPTMYHRKNYCNLLIIRDNGKIVSHVGIYPYDIVSQNQRLKVGGIGGVSTHPDYRKKGYAAELLNFCIEKLEKENYDFSILWGNPSFYQRFGYQPSGKEYIYILNKNILNKSNFFITKYKILLYQPEMLDEIIKFYNKTKPSRVMKSKEKWALLLSLPNRNTFVAYDKDRVVAYCTVGGSKYYEESVVDFATEEDETVLLVLFKHIFNIFNFQQLKVYSPMKIEKLEQMGIRGQTNHLYLLRKINSNAKDISFYIAQIDHI